VFIPLIKELIQFYVMLLTCCD